MSHGHSSSHGKHASLEKKGPGVAKLQKIVEQLHLNPKVKIGVLANKGGRNDGTFSNVDVAIANEYGTPTAPPRPFVSTTADVFREAWLLLMGRTLGLVVDEKITAVQALEIVGQRAVGDMKHVLLEAMWEPNAPSTIARKGSSTPLVDSRQLLNSISYIVNPHAPGHGHGHK